MPALFALVALVLCLLAPAPSEAAVLAPLCAAPASLDAPRDCLLTATFPEVDYTVCFDPSGPIPETCLDRTKMIPVAADGTFVFEGKTYSGAPAGATFVCALKVSLPDGTQVSGRATRPNGAANAADVFQAPAQPQPVAPKLFTPVEVVTPEE